MALFGLFGKKSDVQTEIKEIEKGNQKGKQKICATCGCTYPLETEKCPNCGTRLYIENENFCMNPQCERYTTQYSFNSDEFVCDRCSTPTVVGDISGFNDPID